MPAIRRAPRAPTTPKPKPVPLHQKILGKGAVELDKIEDERLELERAYSLDLIEYDSYLDCHDALDYREAMAKEAIEKQTGRYVKPQKVVDINVQTVRRYPKRYKVWQIKIMIVVCFVIFFKFLGFKA